MELLALFFGRDFVGVMQCQSVVSMRQMTPREGMWWLPILFQLKKHNQICKKPLLRPALGASQGFSFFCFQVPQVGALARILSSN